MRRKIQNKMNLELNSLYKWEGWCSIWLALKTKNYIELGLNKERLMILHSAGILRILRAKNI